MPFPEFWHNFKSFSEQLLHPSSPRQWWWWWWWGSGGGGGGGLILVIPLRLTVRWSIEASIHLTLMIPLILPIQSTVLNNVHLCRQLSSCIEIMHGQQTGGLKVLPFCANRQNVPGIIDSLTPACVVRHKDNKSLKRRHGFLNILHSLLRDVKSSVLLHKAFLWPRCVSLALRKLMSNCVIKVQHLDIEFSSLESPVTILLCHVKNQLPQQN